MGNELMRSLRQFHCLKLEKQLIKHRKITWWIMKQIFAHESDLLTKVSQES